MRLNLALAAFFILATLFQLFALPLWLLPGNPAWGWLLLPLALLTLPSWALAHETFHGTFCRQLRANVIAGRLLAVLFGSPFRVLRLGHLLHHGLSRTPRERSEVFDDRKQSWGAAAPAYYFRLLGGLYLYEVLCVFLFLLPLPWVHTASRWLSTDANVVETMAEQLTKPDALREVRLDALAILLLYGAAFLAYGVHGWMLALALAARGLIVSLNDNAYHYGTPLNDPRYAMCLRLPPALATLALNFNYHGTHHHSPNLGWQDLPYAFEAAGGAFEMDMGRALLRQFKGPVPLSQLSP